jgi:L,D-transpeptidase YcbB
MEYHKRLPLLLIVFYIIACNNNNENSNTGSANAHSNDLITQLNTSLKTNKTIADSLYYPHLLNQFYSNRNNKKVWIKNEKLNDLGILLDSFITNALHYGLFPEDYHYTTLLKNNTEMKSDKTNDKKSISLQSDMLYTDAFFKLAHDLKMGRMNKDSITLTTDTTITESFYIDLIKEDDKKENVFAVLESLEPKHKGYVALRKALPEYIKQLNLKKYTYVVYPNKDSAQLVANLMKRMAEEGLAAYQSKPDSILFASLITKMQTLKAVKAERKRLVSV